MPQRTKMTPRPGFGRRRLIHHAWVKVRERRPLSCVIVSQSGTKALLSFSGPTPRAHSFRLKVEDTETVLECEVYYRRPGILGVRILGECDPSAWNCDQSARN